MEGVALQQVMEVLQPAAVIIGESTNFTLNRAGRGRAEVVVETFGRSAHSSSPQAGLCAVHEMMRLMQAVEAAPMPVHRVIGAAQIVLTDIISEPYPGHSVVPNRCRVSYDRRLVPSETPEGILAGINDLPGLQNVQFRTTVLAGEEKTYTGKSLKGLKFFPAWSFEEDHPIVQASLRGLQAVGIPTRLGSFGFCTNGAYSAGVAGIPTIGFGPGTELDAHTVDERIKVEDIKRAAYGFWGMILSILS
jgi:putative selenium metabolism hydrolase